MEIFKAGDFSLELGRKTYVMGILNVTPDSFSDGGRFFQPLPAARHAFEMQEQGADIIDIGAQSTRPGCLRITPEEECGRLLPVLELLLNRLEIPISVDTFYPQVAELAIRSGAAIINDVNGCEDPGMIELAARSNCGCIVTHHMGEGIDDIIGDINKYFAEKQKLLMDAGIARERICLDPGIGFGKTYTQNLQILANTDKLETGGCALMIAASRKRVIGDSCGNPPFEQRMPGTIAAHTLAAVGKGDIIRVHDVAEAVQAAQVTDAIRRNRLG